jgi:chromosome segregation ATPase
LKYFSPVDNIYEAAAENEIRQYFQERAVRFGNHKELVILDKSQIAGARRFYEDVYSKFSSEVDKLLGKTSELEKDAVYLRELMKGKDERIEDLNKECEGLRESMFEYQRRELDYRKREEDYRDEIARRRQRSGEHRREMEGMMEQLSLSQKALSIAQQEHKRCQDVLCEIALLTPAQRKELADLFAATRAKMDPFLSE